MRGGRGLRFGNNIDFQLAAGCVLCSRLLAVPVLPTSRTGPNSPATTATIIGDLYRRAKSPSGGGGAVPLK